MALFQRRHYNAIAAHIKDKKNESRAVDRGGYLIEELRAVVDLLSELFEDDNENFDAARFISACGVWED